MTRPRLASESTVIQRIARWLGLERSLAPSSPTQQPNRIQTPQLKPSSRSKILFAAAEVSPLAKAGGMADVVGTLPPVLKRMGLDVRIIMPYYSLLAGKIEALGAAVWSTDIMYHTAHIYETVLPNTPVPLYLVDHPVFQHPQIYGGDNEAWRFTFFSNAVVMFAWEYWRPDVVHCHDWHTGMIPVWLHQTPDIGTLFTIHNLAYQGPTREEVEQLTWVPAYMAAHNMMAGGIMYANQVNTVSPNYAKEITTPAYGEALQELLREKGTRLHGILNGIDPQQFDPATDSNLKQPFSPSVLDQREPNKAALQTELNLPVEPELLVIGMVSRLVEQKGIDIAIPAIELAMAYTNIQFAILGSGQPEYEVRLQALADRFPQRIGFQQKFDPQLAQRIYGGSDAFLMPSRFEPCGISQMIALRYGCVPIVRRTGGLADTVIHHQPRKQLGTGYCFDQYDAFDLYTGIVRTWEAHQHQEQWRQLQLRGMAVDHSWERSAQTYQTIYEVIIQEATPFKEEQAKLKTVKA